MDIFNRKSVIKRIVIIVIVLTLCVLTVLTTFKIIEKNFFYPIKYESEVLRFADEYDLLPELVFATIKTESNFDENAVSSAGAKGLMQITDKTGAYIAEKLNLSNYDLFEPNINIRFGCYYLRYLLDKFEVVDTAICAYNAGEGNVTMWLKNSLYSNDGKKLNTIPFLETESYLKKIKKSFKKYIKLYENILDKI